jgi:hypothetical protein
MAPRLPVQKSLSGFPPEVVAVLLTSGIRALFFKLSLIIPDSGKICRD